MNCPVCNSTLHEVQAAAMQIDVCDQGCGGIWFDAGELEDCDEIQESFPAELLRPISNSAVIVNYRKQRSCPKCENTTLERSFYDPESKIEVDRCPQCEGHWLDLGELAQIRTQNKLQIERETAINDHLKRSTSSSNKKSLKAIFELIF